MIYFRGQVEAILKAKDQIISVLEMENERLRQEIELEARRADRAVDRLLNREGVTDITSPPKRKTVDVDEVIRSVQSAVNVGQDFDDKTQ